MKKLIFILAFIVVGTSFASFTKDHLSIKAAEQTEFCKGWSDGYCEGWKDVKGQFSICPIAPVCPVPGVGQDSYRGGYNRGFKAGSRAAHND